MKKLFSTLIIACVFSFSAFAQNISYLDTAYFTSCNSGTNSITPHTSSTPGVTPGDSTLPCMTRGVYISDTIYITNFTTFDGLTVNYLQVDSIYLPTGMCWNTNKANNQFATGESGVIYAYGTTEVPQGQYKLRIIVDANAGIGGVINLTNRDAESLIGLRYRLRIKDQAACPCPAFNHADTTDSYIAYNCVPGGIDQVSADLSDISIAPNPFSRQVTVSFTAATAGLCTLKLTNLIGSDVSAKQMNAQPGANQITIDRDNLPAGIYLMSIATKDNTASRKVIVE